jgi:hypothetical protein
MRPSVRLFASLLALFVLATSGFAVTTATYDITAIPQISISGGLALTSTETTITLTKGQVPGRVVQLTCEQDWGIATATGAFATKQPVPAGVPFTIEIKGDSTVLYVQASSTSGTIHTSALAATSQN